MPENNVMEVCLSDPLQYKAPLPHAGRFYPLGFPADIASNAREVLDAALASWSVYKPRFDRPPLRLHVIVGEDGEAPIPDPVLRGQRHLLMWVSNPDNFAICDWRQRFACSFVTRATVADPVFFRWHFMESL